MKSRCWGLLFCIILILNGCNRTKIEKTDTPLQKSKKLENEVDSKSSREDSQDYLENPERYVEEEIDKYIDTMKLEEKVAQLFIVLPESIIKGVDRVTASGEMTRDALNEMPVGGFVYLSDNLQSEEQVQTMLANVQSYSMECMNLPAFLCIDEEGGTVTRISGTGKFNVPVIGDMCEVGQLQDLDNAYKIGADMGAYLSRLGFNVDFAPVADVLSNPKNNVVKFRSFGSDPSLVSSMSTAISSGMQNYGVFSTYKHFPGHGTTDGDSHEGYAYTDKTLEQLKECELVPFQEGISNDISFMMIGHISLPNIIGDNTPASLSEYMIEEVLRSQMGYEGIVITDAMNMGAIAENYSSSEAAVKALQAGTDIILMPADFYAAYDGVLDAVQSGVISRERIDESLRRIIDVKLQIKEEL